MRYLGEQKLHANASFGCLFISYFQFDFLFCQFCVQFISTLSRCIAKNSTKMNTACLSFNFATWENIWSLKRSDMHAD